jgi:hypothetical protein
VVPVREDIIAPLDLSLNMVVMEPILILINALLEDIVHLAPRIQYHVPLEVIAMKPD